MRLGLIFRIGNTKSVREDLLEARSAYDLWFTEDPRWLILVWWFIFYYLGSAITLNHIVREHRCSWKVHSLGIWIYLLLETALVQPVSATLNVRRWVPRSRTSRHGPSAPVDACFWDPLHVQML